MKKLKILLLVISIVTLVTLSSYAQTFGPNFLGKDYQRYEGVLLKLKDNTKKDGFSCKFYSNLKYCQRVDSNVIYPDRIERFKTVYDSLANRIFIVDDILDKGSKPIFVLKDTDTKQILYFAYNQKDEFSFPFNTSKIIVDLDEKPEKPFCSGIGRSVDDFTDDVTFVISIPRGFGNFGMDPVRVIKTLSKTRTSYYLYFYTYSDFLVVYGEDAAVKFTDGTKWLRSVKIKTDLYPIRAHGVDYEYSVFIALTNADLITFSTKNIEKFRLDIFDEEINPIKAEEFKNYMKCMMKAK